MNFEMEEKFDFNFEDFFKISSLQIELYLPPEEDVEFSTSILINHPKTYLKQAKIIQVPNIEKKIVYMKQLTQENFLKQSIVKKEISVASIWIKACKIIKNYLFSAIYSKHEIRYYV